MSPIAHVSATYILVWFIQFIFGVSFNTQEVFTILIVSNIMDVDYLYARLVGQKGEKHHDLMTHTPLGIVIIWVLTVFVVFSNIQPAAKYALLIGLFVHLLLDEVQFVLYRAKLQKHFSARQINWFYPFTTPTDKFQKTMKLRDIIGKYLPTLLSETVIIVVAAGLFLISFLIVGTV